MRSRQWPGLVSQRDGRQLLQQRPDVQRVAAGVLAQPLPGVAGARSRPSRARASGCRSGGVRPCKRMRRARSASSRDQLSPSLARLWVRLASRTRMLSRRSRRKANSRARADGRSAHWQVVNDDRHRSSLLQRLEHVQ